MDTDFETTQARYAEYIAQVPALLAQTLRGITADDVAGFRALMATRHRIFFTGVGSSMPAAWHGANRLRDQGLPAQFLSTGAILGMSSFGADDVVVLSSQGVNRADALLIIDKTVKAGVPLVLLTANRAADLRAKATQTYYFDPEVEKLFCRPAGVATNFALMEKLCNDTGADDAALVAAWLTGHDTPLALPGTGRYIVLASDGMMPVAWNVSLALREGCGIHSELFDIETYGHGNYVGDLRHRQDRTDFGYILVAGRPESAGAKSVRRIIPFVDGVEAPYEVLVADQPDDATASLSLLASLAGYVYDRNQKETYNMNRPIGKEENRYYHELESYES